MEEIEYNLEDPIIALATPWGESALAVIRTSGPDTIGRVDSLFRGAKKLSGMGGYTLTRGIIQHPATDTAVDDVLAAVFRAPNSYTGEESVELYVHGSLPGIERVLEALHAAGFRDANPGEFTLRAFMNGKLDLTRAEAVHEIVTAKSKQAQGLALHRLTGSVEGAVNRIKADLVHVVGLVELQLDYSEDEGEAEDRAVPLNELGGIRRRCVELGETFSTGRIYQQGVKVALAGRTNAGKSSLFNLFLKEDRSIVSEIHGTTRDYIESWITVRGIPVLLYDTAGLRRADDPVETEGIKRTESVIAQADIVIYLVDASAGLDEEDVSRMGGLEQDLPRIPVWNKIDTPGGAEQKVPEGFIPLSALTMEGFHELEERIAEIAVGNAALPEGGPVIDSLRQKELLDRAAAALQAAERSAARGMPLDMTAMELQDALQALGEITGEVTSADILEMIFSKFCVGK